MEIVGTVSSLLSDKNPHIWTIKPDATVYEAIALMADKNIGAVPVVDRGKLLGMFSERDYTRKVILKGRASDSTRVEEIMTPRVVCVNPRTGTRECMQLMTEKQIRHLPVVEDGRPVGMVSIRDIVGDIIADQDFTIEQLEHYISGQ